MKDADVRTLVRLRLDQAKTALDDAKFLSMVSGVRKASSIEPTMRFSTRCLPYCNKSDRSHRGT